MKHATSSSSWIPKDIHLLGFQFEGLLYFDITLSMGARSACFCCQSTTDVITYIFFKHGFDDVNYLDDIGGAEKEEMAQVAFDTLGNIMDSIGIRESKQKASPPSTVATFLGVLFDTVSMTMEITHERQLEIMTLIDQWLSRTRCPP